MDLTTFVVYDMSAGSQSSKGIVMGWYPNIRIKSLKPNQSNWTHKLSRAKFSFIFSPNFISTEKLINIWTQSEGSLVILGITIPEPDPSLRRERLWPFHFKVWHSTKGFNDKIKIFLRRCTKWIDMTYVSLAWWVICVNRLRHKLDHHPPG